MKRREPRKGSTQDACAPRTAYLLIFALLWPFCFPSSIRFETLLEFSVSSKALLYPSPSERNGRGRGDVQRLALFFAGSVGQLYRASVSWNTPFCADPHEYKE